MGALDDGEIGRLAGLLDTAHRTRSCLSPFCRRAGIDQAGAYAIQRAGLTLRRQRGETPAGFKLGFTSEAMRRQMGIANANIGVLTDAMAAEDVLDAGRLIHPRAEPEIAIRLKRDLGWPATRASVEDAIGACAAAIEIVDSGFHDYRFDLEDNIADNSSAAAFAVGRWRDWPWNLDRLAVRFTIDGRLAEQGDSAAAMGHPLNALVEAARLADAWGYALTAGSIILTGGLTAAPYIHSGQRLSAIIDGLGDVALAVQ